MESTGLIPSGRICRNIFPFTYDSDRSRTQGSRSGHLSRVAVEYTHLLYHTDKARKAECAFVDEIYPVCTYLAASSVHTIYLLFPSE